MKMSVETAFETLQKDQTLLNDYPNIKDEKFKNILPPLVLLSQAKQKELIDKLNKLEFVTEKNLTA